MTDINDKNECCKRALANASRYVMLSLKKYQCYSSFYNEYYIKVSLSTCI